MQATDPRLVADPFTRGRIERIADRALREAGVMGRLPTPLEEVQRAAGIVARHDIAALPSEIATPGRELLGALWFERAHDLRRPGPARAAPALHRRPRGDARPLPVARGRAARGHGVRAVPGHARLDRGRGELRRRRADLPGAGVPRAAGRVAGRACDGANARHGASRLAPRDAAPDGRASPRAGGAPRRRPIPGPERRLGVWGAVASPAFRRRRGPAPRTIGKGTPLRELIEAARSFKAAPPTAISLDGAPCAAEVHYNRRCFLVLLSARRLARRAA